MYDTVSSTVRFCMILSSLTESDFCGSEVDSIVCPLRKKVGAMGVKKLLQHFINHKSCSVPTRQEIRRIRSTNKSSIHSTDREMICSYQIKILSIFTKELFEN